MAEDKKVQLVPCPFCGGSEISRHQTYNQLEIKKQLRNGYAGHENDPDAFSYWASCKSCQASGPWQKSESAAVTSWNMRCLRLVTRDGDHWTGQLAKDEVVEYARAILQTMREVCRTREGGLAFLLALGITDKEGRLNENFR